VSGKIEDFQAPTVNDIESGFDFKQRWDYQLLMANRRLLELDIKNKRASSLPSLSAFANLGLATQSNTFGGVFATNSDVKDNGAIGPDKWYNYSRFGLSLNVPIFSGFQQNYVVQQAKLTLMKTDNSAKQLQSAINLEIKQSRLTFDNAIKTLASQKANMDLAGNVARVTKIKYQQGVGSSLEVIEAESSLRETQINYYNAMYDAMVAKVDIDKAYGKLFPVTK
jgi:outer membrane protein